MQNLFLKIVVLMGVIGGSCVVVWKAHESLNGTAIAQMDADQFVSIADSSSAEQSNNNAPEQDAAQDTIRSETKTTVSRTTRESFAFSAEETEELEPTPARTPPPVGNLFAATVNTPAQADLPRQSEIAGEPELEPTPAEPVASSSSVLHDLFAESDSVRAASTRSETLRSSRSMELKEATDLAMSAPGQVESEQMESDEQAEPVSPLTLRSTNSASLMIPQESPAGQPEEPASEESEKSLAAQSEEVPSVDPFASIAAMPRAESSAPRTLPVLPDPEPLPVRSEEPEREMPDEKLASAPVEDPFSTFPALPKQSQLVLPEEEPNGKLSKAPAPVLLPARSVAEGSDPAEMRVIGATPTQVEIEEEQAGVLSLKSSSERFSMEKRSSVMTADGSFEKDTQIEPTSATSQLTVDVLPERPALPLASAPELLPLSAPNANEFANTGRMPAPKNVPESDWSNLPPAQPAPVRSRESNWSDNGTMNVLSSQLTKTEIETTEITRTQIETRTGSTTENRVDSPAFPTLAAVTPAQKKEPAPQLELPPLPPLGTPSPTITPASAKEVLPEPLPTIVPNGSTPPGALPIVMPVAEPKIESTPEPTAPRTLPKSLPVVEEVLPEIEVPKAQPRSPFPPDSLPKQSPSAVDPALIGTAEPEPMTASGQQSPELKIEKQAPAEAVIGEPVVYAILIRNVGGSPARDVVVEDFIPKGTQLEGTIPQGYLNEGKLSWQLGVIAPGEERKIQLKVVPFESGQIGSVATVSFAAAVSASIKVSAPKLSISMSGPTEAVLGDHVTFRFRLKNEGQGSAKSVYLRAILPPGLKHPGGNDLEYEAGALAAGEEKAIDLIVTPEHIGTFTPIAQISSDNKSHAETRADLHVIKARLELSRTGPENRFVGRPASVLTRITNHSSTRLTNVTVQEKLAQGVELTTIPRSARWDAGKRLVTWTIPQIEPGETLEMNSLLVASSGGTHTGSLIAIDSAGNRVEIPTQLNVKGFAELKADVTASQRTALVGERVSFRLTLKNIGTEAARDVRPRFVFPAGFTFVNATGPTNYKVDGQSVEFETLPELGIALDRVYEIALIAEQPVTSKVSVQLESADYSAPLQSDQPIRVVANTP
ncbi:MAG TPA: hypothetical protein VNQ76_14815 [Planctomicrobium sp.]|nr:hypothetical protein [Planctomicrobium sp.]